MTLAPFLLAAFISAPSGDASGITWIHDDWGKAQRSALETGKLVAVDVWATWCHACLSMKTYVLTQKDLAAVKDKHVWLAVDYDKPANAEFFAKYPINSFPTFMVIDPRSGDLAGRWRGTGTAAEMAAFFATSPENPDDALLRGQRALARGDHQSAVDLLKSAIDDTRNPTKRAKLLSSYLEALWKIDPQRCANEGDLSARNAGKHRRFRLRCV
ncbi:MAG: thioredoxin family protein [Myxococcota bacterium]